MAVTATASIAAGTGVLTAGSPSGGNILAGATVTGPNVTGGLAGALIGAAGTSYVNGTYTNVPLTGGSGSGAQATIVVSGTAVTSVTITTAGTGYLGEDNNLSASNTNLGGSGAGFLGGAQIIPTAPTVIAAYGTGGTTGTGGAGTYATGNTAGAASATLTFTLEQPPIKTPNPLPSFAISGLVAPKPQPLLNITPEPPVPLPQTLTGTTATTSYST